MDWVRGLGPLHTFFVSGFSLCVDLRAYIIKIRLGLWMVNINLTFVFVLLSSDTSDSDCSLDLVVF